MQDISENWIEERFQRYGDIEQIYLSRNENDIIWSYLTYSNDKESYLALNDASTTDKPNEIEEILPADTWCQPQPPSVPLDLRNHTVVETINKLKLAQKGNERGKDSSNLWRQLISLSVSSDSESLQASMDQILPTAEKFTFSLADPNYESNILLGEARSILRSIGAYVCDLGVHFTSEKWPKNIDRYYFKMCQYVGPNLKIMRLKLVPPNEDWLQQLKPLLNRIECLHVQICNYDFDFDIDFQFYCPNLKSLKISMNLKGELLTKPWPKLEKIAIRHNQYMEERLVIEFIKNNSQLRYMKIEANDCNNLLQQIPIYLPKLEKLCLYQAYPNICADNLVHLTEMKHLIKLKLMYLDPDDFDGIVNCLPKFKQLQELKLHIFYDGVDSVDLDDPYQPNLESILVLAQELSQLECFRIRYCHVDTVTLNSFIRNAKKLKFIEIYRCALEITDTVLENIETIRQSINPTMLLLYADKISPELNKEVIEFKKKFLHEIRTHFISISESVSTREVGHVVVTKSSKKKACRD